MEKNHQVNVHLLVEEIFLEDVDKIEIEKEIEKEKENQIEKENPIENHIEIENQIIEIILKEVKNLIYLIKEEILELKNQNIIQEVIEDKKNLNNHLLKEEIHMKNQEEMLILKNYLELIQINMIEIMEEEKEELKEALTEEEFKFYAPVYGINEAPNFENEYYAPQLKLPFKSTADDSKLSVNQLLEKVAPMNAKLLKVREGRIAPATDKKILTEWNGMMIRGFADAGRILDNESYVQTAAKAADFVLKSLRNKDGRLYRTYTNGEAKLNGYLTDYANLIDGLIAIHRATNFLYRKIGKHIESCQNATTLKAF